MIDPAALASLFFEASKEWREPKIAWANVNRLRLLERDGWRPVAERDLVGRPTIFVDRLEELILVHRA